MSLKEILHELKTCKVTEDSRRQRCDLIANEVSKVSNHYNAQQKLIAIKIQIRITELSRNNKISETETAAISTHFLEGPSFSTTFQDTIPKQYESISTRLIYQSVVKVCQVEATKNYTHIYMR